MSRFRSIVLAGALSFAGFAAPASAVTVQFDDFPEAGNNSADYRGGLVTEGGFNFANPSYIQWHDSTAYNADPDGHTLSHNYAETTTTISKVGLGSFDFFSIDLADVYDNSFNAQGGNVEIRWDFTGGGTGATIVAIDGLPGLQTFVLNLVGLDLAFITPLTTNGPFLQFDNVVLDPEAASPVPLPAALPLLIGGLAGLGFLKRRGRHKTAA